MGEYFIKQQSRGPAVPPPIRGPNHPSYVDLDAHIDVARLKSLDLYLRDRLERRIERARDLQFYTGPFLLDGRSPDRPWPRMVYLARSSRGNGLESYYDLDDTGLRRSSEEAAEFSELMDFIATLPFAATGEKLHVDSHSAWFDTANQFHGVDASGGLSYSIRIDGRFSDPFRKRILFPETRRSAAPALWPGAGMRRAEFNQNRARPVLAVERSLRAGCRKEPFDVALCDGSPSRRGAARSGPGPAA